MKTKYLCEPTVVTNNYVSMCSVKVFNYHLLCKYVILELVFVLEEMVLSMEAGTNNVVVLYRKK